MVDEILRIPPRRMGDAPLLKTRKSKAYIDAEGNCNAFGSLWQRFMKKVLSDTKVTDRFQKRDLRAKVASESDTLIEASERLGHANAVFTQRVYRRKPPLPFPMMKNLLSHLAHLLTTVARYLGPNNDSMRCLALR